MLPIPLLICADWERIVQFSGLIFPNPQLINLVQTISL